MADISRRQLIAGTAGLAALGGLAACGSSGSSASTSPTQPAGTPKRGGNFRLGVTGGGSKDIMDGQNIITKPDQARLVTAFETLLLFDDNYQLTNDGLAESVTQDNPKQYTIKLRQGIEFSNGKTLTADDVLYSFQRIGTKGNGLTGYAATATMDIAGMKKLDKYTVRLPLKTPDSTVPQTLASYTFCMVPVGYKAYPHAQVGTGAYKLKSFTPGQQSVHTRNPNYWRSGEPYFDTVTIIDYSDSTAQVNALLGGQIDAMTDLPPPRSRSCRPRHGRAGLQDRRLAADLHGDRHAAVRRRPGAPGDAADRRPAGDDRAGALRVRVRRQRPVRSVRRRLRPLAAAASAGHRGGQVAAQGGRQANLAVRPAHHQWRGRHGRDGDRVRQPGPGRRESRSTCINDPNYYGNQYLKLAFSVDFWGTRSYLNQVQQGSLPNSPYNETHWPPKSGTGSNFIAVQPGAGGDRRAKRIADRARRCRQLEYDIGGYIIPFFGDLIDGYAAKVQGVQAEQGHAQPG